MPTPNAPVRSVETRESWVVAVAALLILGMSYGAPLTTVVALKPIAEELGTTALRPRARRRTDLHRRRRRRHLHGLARGAYRHPRRGHQRRHDDRHRPGLRIVGRPVASVSRQPAAGRIAWRLVDVRAADDLCQPLVRPPPRLRRRADLLRPVHRRRAVAVAVRARHRALSAGAAPCWASASWSSCTSCRSRRGVPAPCPRSAAVRHRRVPARRSGINGARAAHRTLVMRLLALRDRSAAASRWRCRWRIWSRFCTDDRHRPEQGARCCRCCSAARSSPRQFWGWLADRIGGLQTVLLSSLAQAVSMTGFLLTQNEVGLYTASAVFGLGFGGLIPGYVLAVRELFPSRPRQAGACRSCCFPARSAWRSAAGSPV